MRGPLNRGPLTIPMRQASAVRPLEKRGRAGGGYPPVGDAVKGPALERAPPHRVRSWSASAHTSAAPRSTRENKRAKEHR